MEKASVRISNHPAGYPCVSAKHAERWVRQGKATMANGVLTLTTRFRQVLAKSLRPGVQVDGFAYDAVNRPLTSAEKRALPMIGRKFT